MVQEDYCSLELAQTLQEKAKELFEYYHLADDEKIGLYKTVTYQRVMKWLREVHNIFIEVCLCWSENPREFPPQYYALILDTKTGNSLVKISDCKDGMNPIANKSAFPKYFAKYDEAVEKALRYSLENLI